MELTNEDVAQRVAILKRFKSLLKEQRQKFKEYLTVLEKQERTIESLDIDSMVSHTELEQSIVAELHSIQKVIEPMELLYRKTHPDADESEIPQLTTNLNHLKEEVLQQNEKNRELLKSHMALLRQKVVNLKNPYAKRSSIYESDSQSATMIDIKH